jgi:AcrR family transcriptional regulator
LNDAADQPQVERDVRDRIFASALRHFAHKGYAATSLREIAHDAATTKPMIYYYFGSKEGLYSGIVHDILEEMTRTIQRHLPAEASAAERVLAYCEQYIRYFIEKEDTIALVLREVFGRGGAPMDTFTHTLGIEVRRPLDDTLRAGMEAGDFRPGDVVACATAITGIMNMFILARVFAGGEISIDAPIRQVEHYVRGLSDHEKQPKILSGGD